MSVRSECPLGIGDLGAAQLTGKTTLDTKRNATKGAVIITVKDGKFTIYKK